MKCGEFMPLIDNYLLDNYELGGFKSVEPFESTPSLTPAGSSWSSGSNTAGIVIATIPAGTRVLNISPTLLSARLSVNLSVGATGVQQFIGLVDAKGVMWDLCGVSATPSQANISFMQISVHLATSSFCWWTLGNYNAGSSRAWEVASFSKPASFDPEAGPMTLAHCIRGNTGTASGSLYMQYFRVTSA
ncbi:hypothetical protein MHB43_01275 [Paenibacillus sp. FSL H8-0317]|uniref:hypothetical protein n=1 Tax=Paenibacillus sp. FSL H8-0317 TaxID=2921385 RepID=UPI00324BCD75